MTTSAKNEDAVKVWDLPTRLFHWTLVFLVLLAFVSRKFGDSMLVWHMVNGYAILVLIVFRLLWGFFGSSTALFREFLTKPSEVFTYLLGILKGEHRQFVGHNPAGGWSVVFMLAVLALQVITGLFTSDDILVQGPLAFLVSERTMALFSTIHRMGFLLLFVLVVLHVSMLLFYLKQGDNFILPMITGSKSRSNLPPGSNRIKMRGGRPALTLLVLAGVVVWLGISVWKW